LNNIGQLWANVANIEQYWTLDDYKERVGDCSKCWKIVDTYQQRVGKKEQSSGTGGQLWQILDYCGQSSEIDGYIEQL